VPRILLCLAAIAALALPCRAEQTSAAFEMLIRLNVMPAPAPKPALRYQLLPGLKEMHPGNPIQSYMKCSMVQKKFFFDEEAFQHRDKLLTMPLEELPAQELAYHGRYELSQIDWAARLDNPDWQVLRKLKADGIEVLLPEVQEIRAMQRALQVRFRAEIAQGRFDDAIRTAKTFFAMSRHLGEHPTLVGDFVGMAIARVAIYHLEKMLVQPGCPNLYWALTNLPSPLIPLNKGMDGERVMLQWVFRDLNDSAPMSQDQLNVFLAGKDKLLEDGEGKPGKPGVRAWLDARTKDDAVVGAARQRLVESGLSEERLLRFPADQVILLDEKRELEERFDDLVKTINVSFWQVEALDAQIKLKKPPALMHGYLMHGYLMHGYIHNARRAQGGVDQRIALLRHVEALRLYAAEHDGALPAKLSDVLVPLPVDPFTGKPFRYEVTGNTAHLRGTPPPGLEKEPPFNVHYEVTLQK
jgi:hypothetical protein